MFFANLHQSLGNRPALSGKILLVLFVDLIAHAPEDHAGVVAVAPDHVGQIPLMPRLEILMIVIPQLLLFPNIKRLVHHQEAHAVAHLVKFGLARIVARADGIAAHVPENFELTPESGLGNRGSESPEIVVQTNAFDVNAFPVQQKTPVGREFASPDAQRCRVFIRNFAARLDCGHYLIQDRRVRGPE